MAESCTEQLFFTEVGVSWPIKVTFSESLGHKQIHLSFNDKLLYSYPCPTTMRRILTEILKYCERFFKIFISRNVALRVLTVLCIQGCSSTVLTPDDIYPCFT